MRITCPYCGERDRREFTYQGNEIALFRPNEEVTSEIWDDYLHNRKNPAGETRDLWYHDPCGTWIRVTRDTTTHEIAGTEAARGVKR